MAHALRAGVRSPRLRKTALVLVLAFPSAATLAQEAALGAVVVSAAGFEQKIIDAPASISVITQEEIAKSPYTTLIDVVREQEGVDVGETSDKTGQRTISLRGMGSDYTLVLIDGKRQNNHGDIYPNSFGGNQFGHIPPLDAIERVEIIRGPASTLYGADAMGGVINIITKRNADRWTGAVTLAGTHQFDDAFGNDKNLDFSLRGPIVPGLLSMALRGAYYKSDASDPEYAATTDPAGNPVERTVGFGNGGRTVERSTRAYGASLFLTPDAGQRIALDYDHSIQRYDNSESQLGTLDSISTIWRASKGKVQPRVGYADEMEFTRESWSLSHEGEWDFGRSTISLAYIETNNNGRTLPFSVAERDLLQQIYDGTGAYAGLSLDERKAVTEAEFLPRQDRTLQSSQYTLDAKLEIPLEKLAGDHMLIVGGQAIDGELEDDVFGLESGQGGKVQDHRMWSLFVEDNWMMSDRFTLTAGVRHDDHNVFGGHTSPRMYGVYKLAPEWTVKGGVSTGYKTPKTTDLYDGITGFGGQGTSPFAGNPDLEPETSVNSELALYWDSPRRHNFNITAFHNSFKDKIMSGEATQTCAATGGVRPCVNLGTYEDLGYASYRQKINVDKAVIQGLELAGRYQIAPAWAVRANYTYTDSEQRSGSAKGQPLNSTAKHMMNATLDWQANDRLALFLTMEARHRRFYQQDAATDKALYYKDYEIFHLGGSYQLRRNVTLNARINNLLDKDFTTYKAYFVDDGAGGYTATFVDDYNNKDKARNLWVSLNARF